MPIEIPAERLEKLAKRHLKKGSHTSFERGACAMEMVAYIAGEPHSDHPKCVCPVLTSYIIRLNDSMADDATRDRYLKPLLPRLVGTVADLETQQKRAFMLADAAIRIFTPIAFDAAAEKLNAAGLSESAENLTTQAATLRALSPLTAESASASAASAESAARSAAESASASESSAESAAWSARSARSAAWSASASESSAWSARSAAWSARSAESASASATWSAAAAWSAWSAARSAAESAAAETVWQEAVAVIERLLPPPAPFGLDPAFDDRYLTEKEPIDPRDLLEKTQEGGAE